MSDTEALWVWQGVQERGGKTGQLAWGWNSISYQIITCYLRAGITHLSLCHKEPAPCISQSPLPVFSIIICNGDCVGSGEASLLWGVCVCVCVCARVSVSVCVCVCECARRQARKEATSRQGASLVSTVPAGAEKEEGQVSNF